MKLSVEADATLRSEDTHRPVITFEDASPVRHGRRIWTPGRALLKNCVVATAKQKHITIFIYSNIFTIMVRLGQQNYEGPHIYVINI